jgi:large subunit ribosomal protein L24
MSRIKTHVRKGDLVEIIAGSQLYDYQYPADDSQPVTKTKRTADKRRGKVLAVNAAKGTVIVEGFRFIKKHTKKTQTSEGGIIEREGPISLSNVRLAESKPAAKPAAKATKGAKKKSA